MDEDLFIDKSSEIYFNINFNDKTVLSKGYIFYNWCFVNFNDFINMIGYKYVETNYICYDYQGDERTYFGKLYNNETVYYFNIEDRKNSTYHDVNFRSIFAEKSENGVRKEVDLSEWTSSGYMMINGTLYVNICAFAYLFDDMEYMTKIDMDNNEVVIKKYNRADIEQRVGERYGVKAYSICNGANEDYHKSLTTNEYDIYSGINSNNAKEQCKKLLEYIWDINTDDIYLKYDSSLDIYVATAKGNIEIVDDNYLFSEHVVPKLVIRAFDGMVLYPY